MRPENEKVLRSAQRIVDNVRGQMDRELANVRLNEIRKRMAKIDYLENFPNDKAKSAEMAKQLNEVSNYYSLLFKQYRRNFLRRADSPAMCRYMANYGRRKTINGIETASFYHA